MNIAVVAPANRLDSRVAERVLALAEQLYPGRVALSFRPQCHLSAGHFAGDDTARTAAFVDVANDPSVDVVWFARGGYGSCRILEAALPRLGAFARTKTYLGYSDMGSLLGALYGRGFHHVVHGPMPADVTRDGGEAAVRRAFAYLVDGAVETLEPAVLSGAKVAAFNIKTLGELIGTPYQPDLTGHVLLLEEVAEYMYSIDRMLFHITSTPGMRKLAGIKLGRCSQIPSNDPDFGKTEAEVAEYWCGRAGIPYLGRADIGHDADNKVVPFGARLIV
ncbi:MAG: LD-carboxypeptidase [Alphaproteobacteria bacterium]|nr:LD-carboxypeptidase [Alphaproteobacteria bacterium]